jgi:hypothetical protein
MRAVFISQLAIRARAACGVYGKRLTFGGCEMSIRLKRYVKVTLAAVLWAPLVEATPIPAISRCRCASIEGAKGGGAYAAPQMMAASRVGRDKSASSRSAGRRRLNSARRQVAK